MARPLMPKATAVWLIDNTGLTFNQISDFCGLHMLEVQAIADGDVATGMQGLDPVKGGELDQAEIERCEADPAGRLEMTHAATVHAQQQRQKTRYTPVAKRQDRPDAIAWLLKNYPELSDGQIGRLIGTTKPTINAVRERSHWNTPNITPQNPVGLGLCSGTDLEKAIAIARAKPGRATTSPAAAGKPVAGREQRPTASLRTGDTTQVFGASPSAGKSDANAAPDPESVFRPATGAGGKKA